MTLKTSHNRRNPLGKVVSARGSDVIFENFVRSICTLRSPSRHDGHDHQDSHLSLVEIVVDRRDGPRRPRRPRRGPRRDDRVREAPLLPECRYRGHLVVIYVQNMATREVGNKLDKQRQYRKGRDRYERNETEPGSSVSKRRRMNSEFVEKWDAAALKVISHIVLV